MDKSRAKDSFALRGKSTDKSNCYRQSARLSPLNQRPKVENVKPINQLRRAACLTEPSAHLQDPSAWLLNEEEGRNNKKTLNGHKNQLKCHKDFQGSRCVFRGRFLSLFTLKHSTSGWVFFFESQASWKGTDKLPFYRAQSRFWIINCRQTWNKRRKAESIAASLMIYRCDCRDGITCRNYYSTRNFLDKFYWNKSMISGRFIVNGNWAIRVKPGTKVYWLCVTKSEAWSAAIEQSLSTHAALLKPKRFQPSAWWLAAILINFVASARKPRNRLCQGTFFPDGAWPSRTCLLCN